MKKFVYRTAVKWQRERKALLSSSGKPDIGVATGPEFRGHQGIWTPEDLFVASVNTCIMTTFLYYAEKEGLEFSAYESDAEGTLERVEGKFIFSEIKVMPRLSLKSDSDIEKARKLIELSEKACLISNSIKSKVTLAPEIKTGV